MTDPGATYFVNNNITGTLYLDALSIGINAENRIKVEGKIGFVHSIFDRVINITSAKNNLISIVGREVGQGPLNIVSNIPSKVNLATIGLKEGDVVTKNGNLIIIGENVISVSIEGIKSWKPKINFHDKLQPRKIILSNIKILRDTALNYADLNGLGELIPFTNIDGFKVTIPKNLGPVAHIAAPHITSLLKAINFNQTQDIIQFTKKIVGLGPGLTPACDDMLVGLMSSMLYISINFPESSINANTINMAIVSSISDQTTSVSEEFLREASFGRVNEPVASLFENLLISEQRKIVVSAKKVLKLGGTSGTDTVFGIILGSYLMLKKI